MDIAMIGLGKMGANMATRLLGKGHRVVAYDVRKRRSGPRKRGERSEPAPWTKWWGNFLPPVSYG